MPPSSFAYLGKHAPFLVIVSSPSGVGKSTVARCIAKDDQGVFLSISTTTRKKRPAEVDQKDYLFVSQEEFMHEKDKKFLEHAHVFGNDYGTPSKPVEDSLKKGIDVILDVDWQGANALRTLHPKHCVSIFLLPPSVQALYDRLIKRHKSDIHAKERFKSAQNEVKHYKEYDYVLVNDALEDTVMCVEKIITLERWERRLDQTLQKPSSSLCHHVERLCYLAHRKDIDARVQELLIQLERF